MSPRLLRDAAILIACTLLGQWIAPHLPLQLPGSIIGMLLLFALLALGVVKLDWVAEGSELLVKNMAVLFVPLGVGLVAYLGLLRSGLVPFAVSTLMSTLATMVAVGVVFDRLRS